MLFGSRSRPTPALIVGSEFTRHHQKSMLPWSGFQPSPFALGDNLFSRRKSKMAVISMYVVYVMEQVACALVACGHFHQLRGALGASLIGGMDESRFPVTNAVKTSCRYGTFLLNRALSISAPVRQASLLGR